MADNAAGPRQTILVVDDDAMIRRGVVAILVNSGYTVFEAEDGQQALELFATIGEVAMVVTDIYMPRMNGRDLVKNLPLEGRPPVIYMSGFPDARNQLQDGGPLRSDFIAKPFDPEELIAKVRSMLAPPRP